VTIPISALPGISSAEADATTGDWREILQSLFRVTDDWVNGLEPENAPKTVKSFMLEDWNRKNATFGRHMKRSFTVQFITTSPPATVVEPE
jgi:hypothetical protein